MLQERNVIESVVANPPRHRPRPSGSAAGSWRRAVAHAACAASARFGGSALATALTLAATLTPPPVLAVEAAEYVQLARVDPLADLPTLLGSVPRPLGYQDALAYREVFVLQDRGDMAKADAVIAHVDNPLLMGHVLAQRYLHPTAYISSYGELTEWLERYADLPQAERIRRLALRKRPPGAAEPPEAVAGYLGGSGQELLEEMPVAYAGPKGRSAVQERQVRAWLAEVRDLVGRDRPTQATRLLRSPGPADQAERDVARWYIARGYFANRKDEEAYDQAAPAAERSGRVEPRLHWVAGLAAWRLDRAASAAGHFALLADRSSAPEDVAAGAFWAARAYGDIGQPELRAAYLERAAAAGDGFYSLLAQELVGRVEGFDWHQPALRSDMLRLLSRFGGSRRAMALSQIGQRRLAEREIRKLAARAKPNLSQALAALAETLHLPSAQMRVAQRLRLQDGRRHDGAMYPLPPWAPAGGFDVDRAFLFALMRAESGFDPDARSYAGARGLMQLLPSTARAMAARLKVDYPGDDALDRPEVNLTLGQAYVRRLIQTPLLGGDKLKIAMAYNAGLRRMEDWVPRFSDIEDPLLFLESVPVPETRLYAKKALSNHWAYRARLGQPTPSLRSLARGEAPLYVDLDPLNVRLVRTN